MKKKLFWNIGKISKDYWVANCTKCFKKKKVGGDNLFRTYMSDDKKTFYLECVSCETIFEHTKSKKNKKKVETK